jgi:hypothetical protein
MGFKIQFFVSVFAHPVYVSAVACGQGWAAKSIKTTPINLYSKQFNTDANATITANTKASIN